MSLSVPARVRSIELPPFDPLNLRAAELRAAGHNVISLGQALPFYGPPASALSAARAALDTREVNLYVTDPGLPALRAMLAERLGVFALGRPPRLAIDELHLGGEAALGLPGLLGQ